MLCSSSFMFYSFFYLNQRRVDRGHYEWEHIIPIRTARIVKAFRTGPANDDKAIAHFYFKLKNHVQKSEVCDDEIKRILGLQYQKTYASFVWAKPDSLYDKCATPIPFEQLSAKLEEAGFDFQGKEAKCSYLSPLYIYFDGLYKKWIYFKGIRISRGNKLVRPRYDSAASKSYYKLSEAKQYLLKFRTYLETKELLGSFKVSLKSPKDNFATPAVYTQNIKSQYNRETWELTPAFANQNTRNYVVFSTKHLNGKDGEGQKRSLDLAITIPISIRRSKFLRFIEVLSDVGFAFGTLYLGSAEKAFLACSDRWIFLPSIVISSFPSRTRLDFFLILSAGPSSSSSPGGSPAPTSLFRSLPHI